MSGTNGPSTPTIGTLTNLPLYGLGLLAQGSQTSGAAQFLISSFNGSGTVPGGIGAFDLTTSSVTQSSTMVTNNGQAVDMVIGPDGCVYAARGVAVFKITDQTGACTYSAASPAASLYLAPISISPNPAQGSSQTFTASVHYASAPDGTPVLLNVSGANAQVLQANTTGGVASFSYTGLHQGVDTLIASATLNGTGVASNSSVVTWGAGTDVTFLTLNQSPTSGTTGQPVTLTANLIDESLTPVAAISGQQVNFTLGGATCSGTTNSIGNAACGVTPTSTGMMTLSAKFAGTSQYNPSSDSKGFNVLAPTPTPSAALTSTPSPTATSTPQPTATSTPTPTATATATATQTPVPTPTVALACTVTYNRTFNGNLTISSGLVCIINGTVNGNVTQNGGGLFTSKATIDGNLQIFGGSFSIDSGTTVRGNLQVQGSPAGCPKPDLRCGCERESAG